MDYNDNDYEGQNLHLAGEETSKISSVLRPFALPKFDFDDSLHGHLRFDSLVENEVFLGIPSQEDNQWIEDFSRGGNGIEFSSSAAESCALPRHINVWSEATSSESVEMLFKAVGQEEMTPGENMIEESDPGDQLRSSTRQTEDNLRQDCKIDDVDLGNTLPPTEVERNISSLNQNIRVEGVHTEYTTQVQEAKVSSHGICVDSKDGSLTANPENSNVDMTRSSDNQSKTCGLVNESLSSLVQENVPVLGTEIDNTESSSTSSLPDLNTSAPTSAFFQQPFTDLQQVQLRAQIFVYGSLIQGAAPDEAWMVSAFDGGRSVWEPSWRACVERLHGQKIQGNNTETPLPSRSGAKAPDQTNNRQGFPQSEVLTSMANRASNKAIPFPVANDPVIDLGMEELKIGKHVKYILSIEKKKDDFESVVMEHLRLNGAYWGLTTLDVLGKLDAVDVDEVVSWVMECQHESGGFGGNVGHDPHLLYTLSAIQVLALFDKINVLDVKKVANYIASLQNEDGSFSGDMWGEIDTRFSYIAICSLALLHMLDKINVERAVKYIVSCKNLDGGFGCTPGGESHAGQIFCCVGALAITGSLHHIDKDLLGWWLCERQVKSGGLNGRPEKLPDVCYSWWVLSSLIMIDRVHWIDKEKLVNFILDCQDKENGGISDRPDDAVDVFHTYFGVAGLSLLEYPGLKAIDPAYALPVDVVNRIFLHK